MTERVDLDSWLDRAAVGESLKCCATVPAHEIRSVVAELTELRQERAGVRRQAFIDVAAWLDGYCDMALAMRHIRCNVNDTGAPGDGSCLPLPEATDG